MKPRVIVFVATDEVGREATPEDCHDVPHDRVCAEVDLMRSSSRCPSVGVPVRLVVKEVTFAANARRFATSQLSVLMTGVAEDATVAILGVIRLLVRVSVVARPTNVSAVVGTVRAPPLVNSGVYGMSSS
jgi:hypothetical protein